MNAPIADTTIAALSHDTEVGRPHSVPHELPVVAFEALDDGDGDISDAVAALEADTQARDLREESIEDEPPDALSLQPEFASVPLQSMAFDIRMQKILIDRNLKIIDAIADATAGMTMTEVADLLKWIADRLNDSRKVQSAG